MIEIAPTILIILISATTSLIVVTIVEFYEPILERIRLYREKLSWRGTIPRGYKGKDKLFEITRIFKRGTKIKIFDEIYKKVGLIEYNFGGVKYFVVQIKPEKKYQKNLLEDKVAWT